MKTCKAMRKFTAVFLAFCMIVCMLPKADLLASAATESTLNWPQFNGNEAQPFISDAKTPVSGSAMALKWSLKTGNTWCDISGPPVVVGDYAYYCSSLNLWKVDLKTGLAVASAPVFTQATDQYFRYVAYGDGKIFVTCDTDNGSPANSCIIRAVSADTLTQLWVTSSIDENGGANMESPILYHDGYIFTGTYWPGYYACFDTTDENPNFTSEVKSSKWKIKSQDDCGFCWSGAAFVGNYCVFADSGKRSQSSKVWVVNYKTGTIKDSFYLPDGYVSTATILYYQKNKRIYISANSPAGCASIRSYEMNSDGTVNLGSVKEYLSGTDGGGTQSSPVIYNDRVYLGGGGGTMGSSEPFHVIDANTMNEIYSIDGLMTKGSAAVTTAYATKANNQTVYLYMVPYGPDSNDGKSKMYIIKDSIGQTTPSCEVADAGNAQYCSQSVAIDQYGDLLYYNDDGTLYCYGQANPADDVVTGTDVSNQIDRLPAVNDFAYYNSFEVSRIRERYDALDADEKAKVANIQKLTDIEAIASIDPVQRLIDGINSLPLASTITLDDSSKVSSLLAAYNNMDSGNKQKITNADKLLSAEAKIEQLEENAAVSSVIKTINNLPAVSDLTSDDGAKVNSAAAAYGDLSDTLKAAVTNYSKLQQAQARIAVITQQMSDVQTLIKNKLDGVTVTLDTRSIINEIDQACTGLAWSDIQKLTNYEYYASPAKAEIVNLLIRQSIYVNGSEVIPTLQNEDALQSAINEINSYYTGILDCDKIYVEQYDSVQDVQYKISQLGVPAYSETFDNGNVQITAPAGVLPTGAKISISNLTIPSQTVDNVTKKFGEDAKALLYFDVSLTDASNVKIEPNGTVTVRVKLDSRYQNDKNLVVVYIDDDGAITEMPTTIADGYAVFETTHFSHYALVEKTSGSTPTGAATVENPKTGDTHSLPVWALLALPVGMITAAYLRKRRKAI